MDSVETVLRRDILDDGYATRVRADDNVIWIDEKCLSTDRKRVLTASTLLAGARPPPIKGPAQKARTVLPGKLEESLS